MRRNYRVTVTMQREYAASITVRANSQDEADQAAIAAFWKWACEKGLRGLALGLPPPWDEHESTDSDPKIDTRFRCVDCGKDTGGGEYYTVEDDLWAASGAEDGMLCLACLERRIGRPLTEEDFTALCPTASAWKRHLAARHSTDQQLDMWNIAENQTTSFGPGRRLTPEESQSSLAALLNEPEPEADPKITPLNAWRRRDDAT